MEEHMNMESIANYYGIFTKSSYKDRLHVVHYKCDREEVHRNRHGLVEERRVRKAKGSAIIDFPFKGVGREAKVKATHQG